MNSRHGVMGNNKGNNNHYGPFVWLDYFLIIGNTQCEITCLNVHLMHHSTWKIFICPVAVKSHVGLQKCSQYREEVTLIDRHDCVWVALLHTKMSLSVKSIYKFLVDNIDWLVYHISCWFAISITTVNRSREQLEVISCPFVFYLSWKDFILEGMRWYRNSHSAK